MFSGHNVLGVVHECDSSETGWTVLDHAYFGDLLAPAKLDISLAKLGDDLIG